MKTNRSITWTNGAVFAGRKKGCALLSKTLRPLRHSHRGHRDLRGRPNGDAAVGQRLRGGHAGTTGQTCAGQPWRELLVAALTGDDAAIARAERRYETRRKLNIISSSRSSASVALSRKAKTASDHRSITKAWRAPHKKGDTPCPGREQVRPRWGCQKKLMLGAGAMT